MSETLAADALRRLSVCHETRYHYDAPVEVAHHMAHLRPRDTELQTVHDWSLEINPLPASQVQQSQDVFGNWRHGFNHAQVHASLSVVSRFSVSLAPPPPLDTTQSPAWEQVAQGLCYHAGVQQPAAVAFVLGSGFAPVHAQLAGYAPELFSPGRPLLELGLALMTHVYEHMVFNPDSTDVATDALQALALGQGVCQDFAHLMIGVLRSHGLAARYVSGYLLTHPPAGQARLVGADASHAWLDLWCPMHGWVALDPTNNMRAAQDHVTLAWGRDYTDVAPLLGVVRGGGNAPPRVAVTVTPE